MPHVPCSALLFWKRWPSSAAGTASDVELLEQAGGRAHRREWGWQSRDSGRQHELRGSSDLGSNLVFAFDQLCDLG